MCEVILIVQLAETPSPIVSERMPVQVLRLGLVCQGVSSLDGLPHTDTADHGESVEHTAASAVGSRNALSEIVFGCLNIRSLLNKYDDVVKLCRDGQR